MAQIEYDGAGEYPPVQPHHVAALQAFAAKYGRQWKDKLLTKWANGGDDYEPNGPTLREIRNNFGPTWLLDVFKLPK